jgi:DNA adenine methylase
MAEPIIKWAGGKRQLLDAITSRIPREYNRYFEPFFGGGAVFFSLEPQNGYINDINPRLMNFYEQVRSNTETLISENKKLDKEFRDYTSGRAGDEEQSSEDFYYEKREEFNSLRENGECLNKLRESVLFLFLNRYCFNGLYRENEKGEFNVPIGSKPTPVTAIESRIRRARRVLHGTEISTKDFRYIREYVEKDDLVFLDPPYPAESRTAKFNEYGEGGFDEENQKAVRDLAIELHECGAHILLTNGKPALELYEGKMPEDFRIIPLNGKRRINSDASKREDIGTTDILITNSPAFSEQVSLDKYR